MIEDADQISFNAEDIEFELRDEEQCRKWLCKIAANEGSDISRLTYIFCSDEYLLEINKTYLDHDYYTDIITFPYKQGPVLESDMFISIDRIKENATELGVDFEEELHRVMAHGVLHLIGYQDKSDEDISTMRKKEEAALALWESITS